MGRKYQVAFEVGFTNTPIDFLQINPGSTGVVKILRHWLGCNSVSTPQTVRIGTKIVIGVTDGNGSNADIYEKDPSDSSFSGYALKLSGTKATGTYSYIYQNDFHVNNGEVFRYDDSPIIVPGNAFVLELLINMSGTGNITGGIEFEEIV